MSHLILAPLNRQVNFHNISTIKMVHSVAFPSPVVTVAVAVRFPKSTSMCQIFPFQLHDNSSQLKDGKMKAQPEDLDGPKSKLILLESN